jgi:chaperone modulatory protein CbpM
MNQATGPILRAVLIQEQRRYQLQEVSRATGLDANAFVELVACEILSVVEEGPDQYLVSETALMQSKRAARLVRDFELSPQGLALAMRLLERIEQLESTLAQKPGLLHK